jgi:hypothetical protein
VALAGLLVNKLHGDPNLGRTKLAKLFYLADRKAGLQLQTHYAREAAGPLDQRALYNERFGMEALATRHQIFRSEKKGRMVRYRRMADTSAIDLFAREQLGDKTDQVIGIIEACRNLSTDQAEIIATLHACWNDMILRQEPVTDDAVIAEFHGHWHPQKTRFSVSRLRKAIEWMRAHDFVPTGSGSLTSDRPPI